jgi:hypothetical protein
MDNLIGASAGVNHVWAMYITFRPDGAQWAAADSMDTGLSFFGFLKVAGRDIEYLAYRCGSAPTGGRAVHRRGGGRPALSTTGVDKAGDNMSSTAYIDLPMRLPLDCPNSEQCCHATRPVLVRELPYSVVPEAPRLLLLLAVDSAR